MKKNKVSKFVQMIAAMAAILLMMTACGNNSNNGNKAIESDSAQESPAPAEGEGGEAASKLNVVTSFYPLYYLATEIGGEHVQVDNLIAAGVEPHDWTPKSKDLSRASSAQLLLYHGAGLELWIDQFLKGLSKDSKVVTKEMSIGVSLISGEEEAHDHEHEEKHEEGHEEEGDSHATDPHTWVSPKSAMILAENVKTSLADADPANADYYESRYEDLKNKLIELDNQYTTSIAGASQKNMVVSHQAFGYLARDYGLKQVSIMGLSPDAEPRAQDILKIAKFVKENNVKYIFFEELVSDQLAKTLANEADVDTMVLNPLEGLTKEQVKAGETYLSLMESNLQNLMKALQ